MSGKALPEWNGIRVGDRVFVPYRPDVARGKALLVKRVFETTRTPSGVRITVWSGVENQCSGWTTVDPEKCQKAPAGAALAYDPRHCKWGRRSYRAAELAAGAAAEPSRVSIEEAHAAPPPAAERAPKVLPPRPGVRPEEVLAFRPLKPPGRCA